MKLDPSMIPTLTLFCMMAALGMGLRPADFRRLLERPRAMVFGAVGQLFLLPLMFVFAFGVMVRRRRGEKAAARTT